MHRVHGVEHEPDPDSVKIEVSAFEKINWTETGMAMRHGGSAHGSCETWPGATRVSSASIGALHHTAWWVPALHWLCHCFHGNQITQRISSNAPAPWLQGEGGWEGPKRTLWSHQLLLHSYVKSTEQRARKVSRPLLAVNRHR